MDGVTLELFTKLSDSIIKDDWKKALNSLFITLRKAFVFDNLAIYLVEKAGAVPEPVYPRAVGRGRSKEAEVSWGEEIANQVVATEKSLLLPQKILLPLTVLPSHTCLVYPSNFRQVMAQSSLFGLVGRNIPPNKCLWLPWQPCRPLIYLRTAL